MSTAEEVKVWYEGVQLYDAGDIGSAIEVFTNARRTAKILFNIGCCYLRMEDLDTAEKLFQEALTVDQHMAIADFMLGLIYLLSEEYELSLRYFENALDKLRGNRHVDYQQLGFKYKLYACEILTNQAVAAYRKGEVQRAKGFLLQAVGCKAERKHESIEELLSLLQCGYPLNPFIPPQTELFRPSPGAVKNMKKKDFIAKSQVISTENTEEIYSCFSGIKGKTTENRKPHEYRKKLMTDLRDVERKSSLRPTPRPPKSLPRNAGKVVYRPPSIQNKSLPPPPKELPGLPSNPVPANRSVTSPRGRLPSLTPDNSSIENRRNPSPTPMKRLPRSTSAEEQNIPYTAPTKRLPRSTSAGEPGIPPPRQTLPKTPTIDEVPNIQPYRSNKRPPPTPPEDIQPFSSVNKPTPRKSSADLNNNEEALPSRKPRFSREERPPKTKLPPSPAGSLQPPCKPPHRSKAPDDDFSQFGGDVGGQLYEDIHEMDVKYRPPRPPPVLPKRNPDMEDDSAVFNQNQMSMKSTATSPPPQDGRQRRESNAQKPNRAPPPPPTPTLEMSPKEMAVPQRKYSPRSPEVSMNEIDLKKELSAVLRKQSASLPQESKKLTISPPLPETPNGYLIPCYDVEVQYTFVRKIKIPESSSLNEIQQIIQSQAIPDEIEICFNDELGRQQTLTERKLKKVFDQDPSKVKKLYCFPDD